MARDSSVGRERILLVPGSLALDGSAQQQQQPVQADINHQIMEVSLQKYTCVVEFRTEVEFSWPILFLNNFVYK